MRAGFEPKHFLKMLATEAFNVLDPPGAYDMLHGVSHFHSRLPAILIAVLIMCNFTLERIVISTLIRPVAKLDEIVFPTFLYLEGICILSKSKASADRLF